jgi:hypothetical protein
MRELRSMSRRRLDVCDPLLKRLTQSLEDMAAAFGACIQEAHAVMRPRHVPRCRHLAAPIHPTAAIVWCGAGKERIMTKAVQAPVRLATRT